MNTMSEREKKIRAYIKKEILKNEALKSGVNPQILEEFLANLSNNTEGWSIDEIIDILIAMTNEREILKEYTDDERNYFITTIDGMRPDGPKP